MMYHSTHSDSYLLSLFLVEKNFNGVKLKFQEAADISSLRALRGSYCFDTVES